MGSLFSGRDSETGAEIVVAVTHDDSSGTGHTMRMRREALALFKLSHPNLLSILDVGALHGRLYVILAGTHGQSIDHYLATRRHSWRVILNLYTDAGRGLAAAHARAVVHGGITPACIRVADDGRVRVTDFALSRDPQRTGGGASPSSELAALQPYLAPEQKSGAPATIYSDQFSFARCLREALLGGTRWRRLGVPIAIDRALRTASAVNPRERYSSMHELLHDLQPPALPVTLGHALLVAGGLLAAAALTAMTGF